MEESEAETVEGSSEHGEPPTFANFYSRPGFTCFDVYQRGDNPCWEDLTGVNGEEFWFGERPTEARFR